MSPAIRGGAGVVREGREGFVDITGAGGMLGEMGFGGGGLREADFGGGVFGETGCGIGMLAVEVSNEAVFAGRPASRAHFCQFLRQLIRNTILTFTSLNTCRESWCSIQYVTRTNC